MLAALGAPGSLRRHLLAAILLTAFTAGFAFGADGDPIEFAMRYAHKAPKGDEAAYKEKFSKLLAAIEDVAAKKEGASAAYKTAVDCKICHSEHRD